jgi:hypothetical protein
MSKQITILAVLLMGSLALPAQADSSSATNLSGRILLQTESHGEAWYVNPTNFKKYYLGKPNDAFSLMKLFSLGITNKSLLKIPIGLTKDNALDDDHDGLPNNLEQALGTNPAKADSDNDGFDDKSEIINNYNPLGAGKLPIDINFSKKNAGKIFLQVESRGEAWYINPADNKRYFLSRPSDALAIMSELGLGISNNNLEKITTGYFYNQPAEPATSTCSNCQTNKVSEQAIYKAGDAIRANNTSEVATYFTKPMEPIIKYTMNFLTPEGRLIWSEMLSGSSLSSSSDTEKIYHNYVYYQGEKIEIKYRVQKQTDGSWLIANL